MVMSNMLINPDDDERDLNMIKFITIRGSPMRIMWSQHDQSLRKDLLRIWTRHSATKVFFAFGNIVSGKLVSEENRQSKGNAEASERAITKWNGMLLEEKMFSLDPSNLFRSERLEPAPGPGPKTSPMSTLIILVRMSSWDSSLDMVKSHCIGCINIFGECLPDVSYMWCNATC